MYLIDRGRDGEIWSALLDLETVIYEDGLTVPLTTDLLEITYGKYKGWKLSDVADTGYLEWMKKNAVDKDDKFIEKYVTVRLLELSE